MRRFRADERLLDAPRTRERAIHERARRRRRHRIQRSLEQRARSDPAIPRQFGTSAEEMETASAAQIAGSFQMPFLGIRVVSNNITNGEAYDPRAGEACQEFVLKVVQAYFRP